MVRVLLRWAVLFWAVTSVAAPSSLPPRPNKALNESVIFIPNPALGTDLEATLFKPDGAGPFPLLVLNHGKSSGDARQQERTRYPAAAREFVRRGYVVLVPMRGGFSRSTGPYVGKGCNIGANGVAQARDVRAALDYAVTLPFVDRDRILVAGQSHGGLATLAFGMQPYPGVRGLINFAGGLRMQQCENWEDRLVQAFAAYGRQNRYPSLWFYGENDSFWSVATIDRMVEAYRSGGGLLTRVAVGRFKNDAHGLIRDRDGVAIWWPHVERFLAELDMPTAMVPRSDIVADPVQQQVIDAGRALPTAAKRCRQLYETFIDADYPRAFVWADDGRCALSAGGVNTLDRALRACQGSKPLPCRPYVIDDEVQASKPAGP